MKKIRILREILQKTKADKIVASFVLFVLIAAAIIRMAEPSIDSYWDALWYSYVNLFTIGFGDIVHIDETVPSGLFGDETQVRQIFTNILTNAAKYTKRGYIRMYVEWSKDINENYEEIAILNVSIEDTGCGIKEESIPTLFDSFQRADMIKNRTVEGTGLGLAICKRLVESMGGEISVKSSYGVGSVFSGHFLCF